MSHGKFRPLFGWQMFSTRNVTRKFLPAVRVAFLVVFCIFRRVEVACARIEDLAVSSIDTCPFILHTALHLQTANRATEDVWIAMHRRTSVNELRSVLHAAVCKERQYCSRTAVIVITPDETEG